MKRNSFRTLIKSLGVIFGIVSIFSGSLIMFSPSPAQAACAALPSDKGQATFSVSIPTAGTYRVWTRLYPASTGGGKVQMQVDQTSCNILIGQNASLPANQFTWVDYGTSSTVKVNLSLTAGTHSVILAGVDPSVGVDKVMFLTDATCVPTGLGVNCSPAPTATPIPGGGTTPQPTPTATAQSTPTPTPRPNATPTPVVISSGGSTTPTVVSGNITLTPQSPTPNPVTYLIDDQPVGGNKLDTSKLTDGEHVIKQVTTDSTGRLITAKQIIKVENGWQYQLVRGVQGHWQIVSGMVLLLIVVGGIIFFRLTHHLVGSAVRSNLPDGPTAVAVPNSVFDSLPTITNLPKAADHTPPNKSEGS